MAELVLGALCALVGAVVVALVPDADAAGLMLCAIGAVCVAAGLTHGPTLRTRSSGHSLTRGRDDFSTAEVRS